MTFLHKVKHFHIIHVLYLIPVEHCVDKSYLCGSESGLESATKQRRNTITIICSSCWTCSTTNTGQLQLWLYTPLINISSSYSKCRKKTSHVWHRWPSSTFEYKTLTQETSQENADNFLIIFLEYFQWNSEVSCETKCETKCCLL